MDKMPDSLFQELDAIKNRLYDEHGNRRLTLNKALSQYVDMLNALPSDEEAEFMELVEATNLLKCTTPQEGGHHD